LHERVSISNILLDTFQTKTRSLSIEQYYPTRRQRLNAQATQRLVEELEKGKCVVTLGKDRQLLRTVGLCVLDIMDSTGKVLVQIATKKQEEDAALDIALPATKVRESVSNRQAAMRLIQMELPEMEGTLNFGEVLNEEQEKSSKHFGVRTIYLKTTYNASLWPEHFQDLRNTLNPKLVVSDPPSEWTRSQSLAANGRGSLFLSLQKAVDVVVSGTSASSLSDTGSVESKLLISNITIIPVKCNDKVKFYAWLQRRDFHQVKQALPTQELELMAKVLESFSEMASQQEDVESDDAGGVEV